MTSPEPCLTSPARPASPADCAEQFAALAASIETRLRGLDRAEIGPALASWPRNPPRRALAPAPAAGLPVLRWLPHVARDAGSWAGEIVASLCRAAPALAWRQTYTARQVGAAFIDNYGHCEILGTSGPLASERVACGFLLLGPGTYYPRHRHEAEELYVPLSGTAGWQQGDALWRDHPPGTPIWHLSGEPHAMRTGTDPLLALYVWHSENLHQQSQLVEDAAAR